MERPLIWAGRLNAITILAVIVGMCMVWLTVVLPYDWTVLRNILQGLGLLLAVGAIVGRIGFVLADMVKRAFYGEPLVYDQKLSLDRANGGQISE